MGFQHSFHSYFPRLSYLTTLISDGFEHITGQPIANERERNKEEEEEAYNRLLFFL